jgi:hypothetical protein
LLDEFNELPADGKQREDDPEQEVIVRPGCRRKFRRLGAHVAFFSRPCSMPSTSGSDANRAALAAAAALHRRRALRQAKIVKI